MRVFDMHVHIGQFEECYFYPYKIVEALKKNNVVGAYISSTTSCIHWDNDEEKEIIINHIVDEFNETIDFAKREEFDARPLCWVIPQRYFEGETVESIFAEVPYKGFKIHPRAQEWELHDVRVHALMDEVCECANNASVPILIHTGLCDFESPNKFEEWYKKYPNIVFILAHCKNQKKTLEMLIKYPNVFGDLAFANPKESAWGYFKSYENRLLYGTDFPITVYNKSIKNVSDELLEYNYKSILLDWEKYMRFVKNTYFFAMKKYKLKSFSNERRLL